MTRDIVEEARNVLVLLRFDRERSNQRSALTLLALLHLRRGDQWSEATTPMLGTRAVMDWIRDEYGVDYKPNTRETLRR
jgi:type II restriction enzyme